MFAPTSSWQAALRIARREVMRNRGRHALVALLIALPVFALAAVDVIAQSERLEPRDKVAVTLGGSAQALLQYYGGRVQQYPDSGDWLSTEGADGVTIPESRAAQKTLLTALPPGSTLVPALAFAGPSLRVNKQSVGAQWLEIDLSKATGLATLVTGSLPRDAGEVVISSALARSHGLTSGDTLTVNTADPQAARLNGLRVAGVVRMPSHRGSAAVIALPGTFDEALLQSASFYLYAPEPVTWPMVLRINELGASVYSRAVILNPPAREQIPLAREWDSGPTDHRKLWVAMIAGVLMVLQVVLLAGPALAVGARRNQRSLALVMASGGEQRHARRIVLANAAVVGVASSLVAATLGVGLGTLATMMLRDREKTTAPRIDIGWLDISALVVLGAGTALAAALIPARQAARMDVVLALTGRQGQASIARRLPVLGLIVAVAGFGAAVWGAKNHLVVLAAGGIAIGEIGLVMLSGTVVLLAARLARRTPLAMRIAARDGARHRGRTAPAVAAVMAAVIGGLASLLFLSSQNAHDASTYRARYPYGVSAAAWDGESAVPLERIESLLRNRLSVLDLTRHAIVNGVSTERPKNQQCPSDGAPSDPRCQYPGLALTGVYGTTVDDSGAAVRALTGELHSADATALAAGKVLVNNPLELWPDGTVHLVYMSADVSTAQDAVRLTTPGAVMQGARMAEPVIPASVAAKLGATPRVAEIVATTSQLPTQTQEQEVQAGLEDLGAFTDLWFYVERGYRKDVNYGLLALVIAAAIVALIGSLTAVGLASAEGRADAATLMAVGAAPGMRRRVAAAQAAMVVILGVLLGTIGGFVAGYAMVLIQRPSNESLSEVMNNGSWDLVVPWPFVTAILVGIPVLTVGLAFLTARTSLTLSRRVAG